MASPPQQAPNGAKRSELRRRAFEMKLGGASYRAIAKALGFSSTNTVSRLLHEQYAAVEGPLLTEIRNNELAHLDVWHERLEEAYELLMQLGEKPEGVAALAMSAARLSESRRKILAVDVPPLMKVMSVNAAVTPPPAPELAQWVKHFQDSDLGKRDMEEVEADG